MKHIFAAAAFAAALVSFGAAQAQTADDKKWVAQCLADNADAKVAPAVVEKYCVCMNDKMSDNETRTITQWEKANPNARAACEKAAGWN
jgi:hypothetical protein